MTNTWTDEEWAELERAACVADKVALDHFNPRAKLPYGLRVEHVAAAMNEFIDFISYIGLQLRAKNLSRLESMLMPANLSSMVGEFVGAAIPRHCATIVRNQYHNGHPDLIPSGMFPRDSVQHADKGVEIKASRYLKGWQGHNAEDAFLMVFCFDSSRPVDRSKEIAPKPFRFLKVAAAKLEKADWTFAGRSETSRRTITAAVNGSGYEKMMKNWIYKAPDLAEGQANLVVGDDDA